ncbi:L,D-transpeptidase family protein [Flavobacteriaceae bacterium F08102]|nr:L,D-transpeptidase family protein [Flavobacteriaceae bacterium F08102]
MKKLLVLLALLSMLYACQKKSPVQARDYRADFQTYFKQNFESLVHRDTDSLRWLQNLYQERNYRPIWTGDSLKLDSVAFSLMAVLNEAQAYGLEPFYYEVNRIYEIKRKLEKEESDKLKLEALANLEILLSKNYMKFGRHLNVGILEGVDTIAEIPRKPFAIDMPSYVNNAAEKDSLLPYLLNLQPRQGPYKKLQKAAARYVRTASFSAEQVEVVNYRIDSLKSVALAKKALVLHQYLTEELKDSLYFNALTKFQIDHGLQPDSLIGSNTARALSISPYEYYQKLKVSLERWRWKNEWKGHYVFVNIPMYELKVFRGDSLQQRHRVVVGSRSNRTPEMVDTLEYIIAYPFWNVPKRISVEEILVKAQNDSTYLKRNQYQVSLKGEVIDPKSVDWNKVTPATFNYRIRQNGGGINALGYVKFIFPNKDAIYFHDTPTKSYFNKEIRAYSHGCIRVQNALELADYFLKEDKNKYTKDSLRTFIKRKKEKWMHLNTELPVYIYYIPTTADDNGNIIFHQDVYNLDKLWIQLMSKQGVKISGSKA